MRDYLDSVAGDGISPPHMPLDDAPERYLHMYSPERVPIRDNVWRDDVVRAAGRRRGGPRGSCARGRWRARFATRT